MSGSMLSPLQRLRGNQHKPTKHIFSEEQCLLHPRQAKQEQLQVDLRNPHGAGATEADLSDGESS